MGGHLVEAGRAKKDGKLPLTAGLEERPIGRPEATKAVLHPEVNKTKKKIQDASLINLNF